MQQRVINVSNAPPVSLTRKGSGCWEIKQGSGGLVACVDPVMSVDKENIWLANLGVNVQSPSDRVSESEQVFACDFNQVEELNYFLFSLQHDTYV